MATKKVKKFGRGGDILTGLGAGLAAFGAYKHFFGDKDKDKEQTSTGRDVSEPPPRDRGRKGEDLIRDAIEGKKGDKTDSGRNSARSPVEEHEYITSGGSSDSEPDTTPVDPNNKKPRDVRKADANNASSNNKKNNASSNANKNSGKSKPYPLNTVPNEDRKSKPYPVNLPAVREIEHQRFLSSRGITTPGNAKAGDKSGSTQKGRSANPIQETIDNAFKSTVRSDADKMRERALEVDRRRQEDKRRKKFEAEAASGRGIKKGGMVKKYASGGSVKRSASSRADGIAIRGKTRA